MKGLNVQKRLYSNRLTYMMKKAARAEEELKDELIQHARTEALKPGAKANVMEIYANLKGWLVKKEEVKHKFELSADEHFRIRENAKQRISEILGGTDGNRGLLPEHSIHVEEIREDKGQTGGANSVDSVAAST